MKRGELRRFSANVSPALFAGRTFLVVSAYHFMSVERVDILMDGQLHEDWLGSFVRKNSEVLDETG
jgi:hypothetical protein